MSDHYKAGEQRRRAVRGEVHTIVTGYVQSAEQALNVALREHRWGPSTCMECGMSYCDYFGGAFFENLFCKGKEL